MNYKEYIQAFLTKRGYDSFEPKAALIDMDGVLFDSMPRHAQAWYKMVTNHGLDATPEEFFLYEGMTGAATINLLFQRHYGRDASADEITALYREKSDNFKAQGEAPLMPGASDMLKILEAEGVKRVLVTGSAQHSLIGRIEAAYPGAFLPGMHITADDVCHGKPDPEPYLKGMRKAQVKPNEAIVIENAPCGVTAGARSGAFTVGLTTGPIPAEKLIEAGADITFPSMSDFAKALPELIETLRTTC